MCFAGFANAHTGTSELTKFVGGWDKYVQCCKKFFEFMQESAS